jgi:hypothetical protein
VTGPRARFDNRLAGTVSFGRKADANREQIVPIQLEVILWEANYHAFQLSGAIIGYPQIRRNVNKLSALSQKMGMTIMIQASRSINQAV